MCIHVIVSKSVFLILAKLDISHQKFSLDTSHTTVLDVSKCDLIRDRFRIIRRKSLQVGVNPKA